VKKPKTGIALAKHLRALSNRLFDRDRATRERTGCLDTGDGKASRLLDEAVEWILNAELALRRGDGDGKPSEAAEPGKSKSQKENPEARS
jgi:hypothetical protein